MSDLVKKTKLNELENKTPDVSSLATEIALIAVETKIPSVSSLVKKKNKKKKQTMAQKLVSWKETYWSYSRQIYYNSIV